ncbi:MAG: hypothetical protein DRP79_09575 [Planctomycetota bacterium]|nr:MAG: hypothetical protein DRP79_09575 [Planctomycetota bacterium]
MSFPLRSKRRPLCRVDAYAKIILCTFLLGAIGISCLSGPQPTAPAPIGDSPPALGPGGARTKEEKTALIEWLGFHAVRERQNSGIPASITIAQAILETGWLRADTPARRKMICEGRNLFGIKGTGTAGYVEIPTHEYINGRMVSVTAKFRAYHTFGESFEDHSRLLTTSRYYTGALNYRDDPRRYIGEVAKKYATDPNYADKVWSIVTRYNLTRFDKHGNGRPGPQE